MKTKKLSQIAIEESELELWTRVLDETKLMTNADRAVKYVNKNRNYKIYYNKSDSYFVQNTNNKGESE